MDWRYKMDELFNIIAQLKTEYPTLKIGNDEDGYSELSAEEYEATITNWAQNLLDNPIKPPIWA